MSLFSLGRKLSFFLAGLLLWGVASPVAAWADAVIQDDLQAWQIVALRGHLTKRIMGYVDSQNFEVNLSNKPGHSTRNTHEGQLVLRSALGFQVTRTLSVWQGIAWGPSFQPQFRNERQHWEQILYERRFKYLSLSNRLRLESRYIENTTGGASVRLREQLRVAVPLGKTKWSLVAYDEPFYNLNTVGGGPKHGFNQNWAFLGVNRHLSKALSLEAGYLNNYVRNFRPVPNRMNHVFFVAVVCNLGNAGIDLRKPKGAATSAKTEAERPLCLGSPLAKVDFTRLSPVTSEPASLDGPPSQSAGLPAPTTIPPDLEIAPVVFQGAATQ